jgi:hypothetical protein
MSALRLNDWRYQCYRPGVAHLWTQTKGGLMRSACGRLVLRDLNTTVPLLALDALQQPKCRVCIPYEVRRG